MDEIGDQIERQDQGGVDDHHAHHHRIVALKGADDEEFAQARQAENPLHHQ